MSKGKLSDLVNGDKPVLIDFHATWCQPCHQLAPVIRNLAQNHADQIRVIKIDIDKNPQVANKYQIRGVPTLILFKNGKVEWRQSGVVPEIVIEKEIRKLI